MDFYKNELPVFKVVMTDELTGAEKIGITPTSVYLVKGSAAPAALTVGVHYSWAELDNINTKGAYRLTALTTTFTDTVGDCLVYVNAAGCVPSKRGYTVQVSKMAFDSGGDTVAPTVTSILPASLRSLRVTFSKPVKMINAANGALYLTNYSIDGGITVNSVTQVDDVTVELATSLQVASTSYNLTITGVEDLAGNPIV